MQVLNIKPENTCVFDLLSLGEIMLRLDPGQGRIHTTRSFQVWEGGGEYNVARGLHRCFGRRSTVVTALADNAVGRLVEDLILQGGINTSFVQWVPYDGIGQTVRNGLNFTERGFGIRGALGVSDRGNTAVSQLKKGDVPWDHIFGEIGVRWFHCGGIFAALSASTPDVIEEAMIAARHNGTIISYDLNYRHSLWKSIGGKTKAQEINRRLARYVDVMLGNEEDFTACLGFEVEGVDQNLSALEISSFQKMIKRVVQDFPNFKVIATTLRTVKTATVNDWGAICWADGKFYQAPIFKRLEIMDRVGGGDSFASGLIYGLMTTGNPQTAVEYGTAHGALAMTTPGDTSMANVKEVEKIMAGGSVRVDR